MITGVSKYDRPDRPSRYGIRWMLDGQRRFRFYRTKAARDAEYRDLRARVENQGRAILRLSSLQAALFEQCLAMVGSEEALVQACRDYADKHSVVAVEPRTTSTRGATRSPAPPRPQGSPASTSGSGAAGKAAWPTTTRTTGRVTSTGWTKSRSLGGYQNGRGLRQRGIVLDSPDHEL
jgi:hypothetical protein